MSAPPPLPQMPTRLRLAGDPHQSTVEAELMRSIRPAAPPEVSARAPIELQGLEGEIEVQELLGTGGMGLVHSGLQRSLGRKVAVKSVKPGAPRGPARSSLLREAWAVAALEHPNIVPIYTAGLDAQDEVQVVMRRISGRTWTELLVEPERVLQDFGARDRLGWHLGVLIQICNAVHYAHSLGILHRDLKPDNVMIGPYGQVYLLDWGLAVRLDERGPAQVPLARLDRRVVGTPMFMAPEMARGDGPALSERTDVYLLGGLLYAILTGCCPHRGANVEEVLASIPRFRPELAPETPARLAGLVRSALSAEPGLRPASAEALRLELQAFLEERSAEEQAAEAQGQLERLRAALAERPVDREEIYRRFGACRYAFQQVLEDQPQHAASAEGLRTALIAMCRFELRQRDARAVSLLLSEIADPPEELVGGHVGLRAAVESEAASQARLREERDSSTRQRTRIFVFSLVMVIWTLLPLIGWLLGIHATQGWLLSTHAGMTMLSILLVVWARDSLSRSELNRRIAAALIAVHLAMLLADLLAPPLGMTAAQIVMLNQLVLSLMSGLTALTTDRRALLPTVGYVVAMVGSVFWPAAMQPLMALSNLLVAVVAFVVWTPEGVESLRRRVE